MRDLTVNRLLRDFRGDWPGGLDQKQYSTLNLIAHCRHGELGFNRAECRSCHRGQWFPSSCGDRHCPQCLGPRQAAWSESVCERLPDCPHFHVIFTVPSGVHGFFELNYRVASDLLFAAAAQTLQIFQRKHWKMRGAFLGVLHTWGSRLNWHPHLHVLVSSGGEDLSTGRWREARKNYLFAVKSMSQIFRAIMLRKIEELDSRSDIIWPDQARAVEQRRAWRLQLARAGWNIFSRPTLGNTKAVVRYLARYTSRIAMSNHRILEIDDERKRVTFAFTNYRKQGSKETMTLSIARFLKRFARHLVPKGFRRVRYYGLLTGRTGRVREVPGAPEGRVIEKAIKTPRNQCPHCEGTRWRFDHFFTTRRACMEKAGYLQGFELPGGGSFSLPPP